MGTRYRGYCIWDEDKIRGGGGGDKIPCGILSPGTRYRGGWGQDKLEHRSVDKYGHLGFFLLSLLLCNQPRNFVETWHMDSSQPLEVFP